MEMKAVCEYEEPEYATLEDGRSKFFMNCKKVGIGVLCLLLLSNDVIAFDPTSVAISIEPPEVMGVQVSLVSEFINITKWILCFISVILLTSSIVFWTKNIKAEDEERKKEIKKRCKLCVILAIVLMAIFVLIDIWFNLSTIGTLFTSEMILEE